MSAALPPLSTAGLRRLDCWVGAPVCFLLTVWRRLWGSTKTPLEPPRRVLLLKFAEQGSTVLAAGAIRRAIELVGRENVHFAAFQENRFVLDAMNLLPPGNVLTVDARTLPSLIFGTLRLVREARRLRVDATVDFEFFSRGTAALAFLTGARQRVGLHASFGESPYRGDLLTHRVLYNAGLHTARMFRSLVDAFGTDASRLPAFDRPVPAPDFNLPAYQPLASDLTRLRTLLPPGEGPLILLNPNAGDLLPLRRWPAERYAALARRILAERLGSRVVFTGAPGESASANQLAGEVNSPNCRSLAGQTTLPELLALYTLADVLITNDSGPAHFAGLTPIRSITLFGPETPALFSPLSGRSRVIWRGIACSPCVNAYNGRQSACRDNVCMQGITVDAVYGALEEALAEG